MGTTQPSNVAITTRLRRWLSVIGKQAKYALILLAGLCLFASATLYGLDRWISWQTQDAILDDVQALPFFPVAVVLGTSKYSARNVVNEYYQYRINAAITLYQQHKVGALLLSGDNAHLSYNEPWTMKRDLLKAGIPNEHLYLDYAGFRTLDSILRAKHIFDTDHFLIITQRFHCERALFIAQHHRISAHCLAVSDPTRHLGFQVRLREVFARAKAFADLYLLNTQPKFLGPKEPIMPSAIDSSHTADHLPIPISQDHE